MMKIRKEDYEDVRNYLLRKRWEGEEFVAFPDSVPVNKDELFTFSKEYDVKEFCYEMSTDADQYGYLAIRSAYRAMDEARNDAHLMVERNGIVDVQLMVSLNYKQFETFNNNIKSKVMNQNNFEFLRAQVTYAGFGESLENDLKRNMQEGKPDFSLQHQTKYGDKTVLSTLLFNQSKKNDMYFFNFYKVATVDKDDLNLMEQTFYVNKSKNITLKEAFNLMEGRAVYKGLNTKDGQAYNAWLVMDFKEIDQYGNYKIKPFYDKYGYDLEYAVAQHPIKELADPKLTSDMLTSLKKGNLQAVTFQVGGEDEKRYIAADPAFRTIKIYDANLQPLNQIKSKKETQSESESQSAKQDNKKEQKQAASDDDGAPEIPKASKKRRRKQSVS